MDVYQIVTEKIVNLLEQGTMADSLKYPSPLGPELGVPTALHSILRLSKREDFMFAPAETVLESTQKVN